MVTTQAQTFHWVDYLVFAVSLLISAGIGVYYGVVDYRRRALRKRQAKADPTRDIRRGSGLKRQLLGGQEMSALPVAMSILASFLSAPFLLGTPTELYLYGSMYAASLVAYPFTAAITAHLFVPVFHRQQVASSYEYLQKRYDRKVRLLSSLTFCLMMVMYMGVVIYAPAAAFSIVTGLRTDWAIMATGLICTFYTAFGGMKAVIWTDVLQMLIILAGMIALTVVGLIEAGGPGEVFTKVWEGGRIQLDVASLNPDPSVRHSWWTQIIGGIFLNLSLAATNQAMIQRYLSIKSTKEAQKCCYMAIGILEIYLLLVLLMGFVMFAYYYGCDPLTTGKIDNRDQLMPVFVMDCLGKWIGLPGLFTSAVFSASLSTVSSGLNALSAVIISDMAHPLYFKLKGDMMADNTSSILSKVLSLVLGLVTVALAFVAPFMGNTLLQIASSLFGLIGGPLLGLFSMAIFVPCSNSWGAFTGTISSLLITGWIAVGSFMYPNKPQMLPLETFNCPSDVSNLTTAVYTSTVATIGTTTEAAPESGGFTDIYKLSYMWYTLVSFLGCMIVGIPVSLLTGGNKDRYLDPTLLYDYKTKCGSCASLACCKSEMMGKREPEMTPSEIDEEERRRIKMRKFSTKSVVTFADVDEAIEAESTGIDMDSGSIDGASDLTSERTSEDDVSSVSTYSDREDIYIISDGAVYRKQSELDDIDLIGHWRRDSQAYEDMIRRKSIAMSGVINKAFAIEEEPEKDNNLEKGHLRPTTVEGTRDKVPTYSWDKEKEDEDAGRTWL